MHTLREHELGGRAWWPVDYDGAGRYWGHPDAYWKPILESRDHNGWPAVSIDVYNDK